jgi:DNA-binding beta-propeller fold protein YncE
MNTLNPSRKMAMRLRVGDFLIILVMAGLLAVVLPLRADNPPTYLFEIDASAVAGGFDPHAVAVDSSNNVYVADYSNSRIVKFSGNGTYLTQWGSNGTGPGQFESPFGAAVDSSNNVYVVDDGNNRVEKFDSNGNYLTQWGSAGSGNGQLEYPHGIAVDTSNNVYVADSYNNRVEKFGSNGNYLTQWGSAGSGNGQFNYSWGIAVDSSNNVYVSDDGNSRIEKFDSNGNYLTQWGSAGGGNGQFESPLGVAVDSSNNIYVIDYGSNNRVEKFESNGNYLTQWGASGSGNGQFESPLGVAVDSSGNFIYVADSNNNRILVFVNNTNIIPPFITQQPTNQIVPAGINVTFGIIAVGGTSLSYQWTSNNVVVSGATNATFTLTNVSLSASGSYYFVLVTNNFGSELSSNAVLTVLPPLVTTQPTSQVVLGGSDVTFKVNLLGTPPFAYQWIFNNVAVPAATNATFMLTNVSPSASGAYSVLVTNNYGSVLSSNAVLTVLPAFVTTPPASGLSATGAVLNGSVTVGPDETVVWFDWGTDTNYGNIAGATIVPGGNGSNSISIALSGLPGNVYHYRMDAANDFGIVYGNDQVFTVGFAPSATTLPSTNGANGSTLEATVNPQGWDTTVYFRWGTPTLDNTTPSMDIGAGATSLNVSSFVPGLTPFTPYKYQVVASNALGTAVGKVVYGDRNQHPYLFSGSKTNITLAPGTYIITAYGAQGGSGPSYGGFGDWWSAEFNFSMSTNLTLLVGGAGGNGGYHGYFESGGGGGGGSFVVEGSTPLVIAGGGGGGGGGYWGGWGGWDGTNGAAGGFNGDAGGDGLGGTGGAGGGGGIGINIQYSAGGGGGGFMGDGTDGTGYGSLQGGGSGGGAGGGSFESGGGPIIGGGYGSPSFSDGGFGGGGGGGTGYIGGGGGGGGYSGGGGAGDQNGNSDVGGGGGGGSIVDSSAIAILFPPTYSSPDDRYNGEIIITALPPPLAIIADGANVVLTWPAADTGFTTSGYWVVSATNLVPPVVWQTNSTAPVIIGGQNVVTNPITGSQQFFQLFSP